jgi:DNA/RNA endonuclease G (NUC1)
VYANTAHSTYTVLHNNVKEYNSFDLDFNTTTMQANWVKYTINGGRNGCYNCKWQNVNYSKIITGCYPGCSIDKNHSRHCLYNRGHLVPNAELGPFTWIISNAVPMYAKFNSGKWLSSERYLRSHYAGKTVFKGCEYNYMNTYRNAKCVMDLYIPLGCYYVVVKEIGNVFELIDYGYWTNRIYEPIFTKELPWWFVPVANNTTSSTTTTSYATTSVASAKNNWIQIFN